MTIRDRALGAWYGQLIGDNLGALVEFRRPGEIAAAYPDGVREMADGGTHNIAAGQPTDDSEMALALARSLVRNGGYDRADVLDGGHLGVREVAVHGTAAGPPATTC